MPKVTSSLVLAAVLVLSAACASDQQSAVTADSEAAELGTPPAATEVEVDMLTVDKPPPDLEGVSNCPGAVAIHDNKHNVCATWVNDAPVFTGPAVLSNAAPNFTVSSFDANGTSAHHVTQSPAPFGPSTWGATSAQTGYGAAMNWTFKSAEPDETVNGSATQDGDNDKSATCSSATQYVACDVMSSTITAINGERAHILSYGLLNAPLSVQVINNTGKPMARAAQPLLNQMKSSAAGSANTVSIAPAAGGQASSAIFGLYRSASGKSASFQTVFSFPDTNDAAVTHKVTVTAELAVVKPTDGSAGDPRTWRVDTSKSSCVDNPIGGSSPAKATCDIGWSGNTSWFASTAMTVNVSNA